MPSTHTASAFAFVGSLAVDDLAAASFLLPVAAFVAWSRVAAARHYPSDVAAGVLVGACSAAIASMPVVWLHRRLGRAATGGS
jgi:undecaprenyl-diphosphatase